MLTVYTAQKHHYDGPDKLDVSSAIGSDLAAPFAPSWKLIRPLTAARRNGGDIETAWAFFENDYLMQLRESYRQNRAQWIELLARSQVTLCCGCDLNQVAEKCHRLLLANVLVKLGASYKGER